MAEDPYKVRLPVFEGPLDLLLHLIRKNEVDIEDVRLEEITHQYLEYMDLMQELDLDIAGEFLVMASTLLLIKSRALLPSEPETTSGQEEEESDPRLDLIRQLMEYRRFKDASERMADMQTHRAQMVFRGADELGTKDLHPSPRPLQEISLFDLLEAFRKVLDAAESRDTSREIGGPRFTIRDRITHILSGLRRFPRLSFQQLFQGSTTREELVVSFLALLELIRLQKVLFIQDHPFGEIWIELRVGGTARDEDEGQAEGYEEYE